MSIVSLFKKPAPAEQPPPEGPHRAALRAHVASMAAIEARRKTLHESMARAGAEIDDANAYASRVAEKERAIDARAIASAIKGTPDAEGLAEDRAILASMHDRLAIHQDRARIAALARDELQAQSNALLNDYRKLQPALAPLMLNVLVEDMRALHPALIDAQEAFHKVLRQSFVFAAAIDKLSAANNLGVYTDWQRFEMRHVPLPKLEPFTPAFVNNDVRVRQLHADNAALHADADALLGTLLQDGG